MLSVVRFIGTYIYMGNFRYLKFANNEITGVYELEKKVINSVSDLRVHVSTRDYRVEHNAIQIYLLICKTY